MAAQFQRTYEEGCPFQFKESRYRPCDVCAADFASTDPNAGLSQGCVNAISRHCKYYYKKDDDACTDFPEIIVGGGCDYDKLPKSAVQALELGVKVGRNGKGVIYTFASGNKFSEGDDVNFSGWTNSRYTITVGAVGKDGSHADYSTGGSALVVSAPGGGPRDVGHLMTAGLGVDTCADSGQGTSFACPVVSAVIALMLEANSELSWRDVQGILAKTSRQVDDDEDVDDDSKVVVNGAGFWHSRWYGFGVVDAKAAVDAALEWDLFPEELQAIGLSEEENVVLQCDEEEEYVSTIQLDPEQDRYPTDFVSESTVVLLDLSHYNRGDLELILVSPSGTESLLHAGKRPENSQLEGTERWKLMTVRNWGEDPTGKWKLKVRDLIDREDVIDENVFRSWKLIVYGRSDVPSIPSVEPTSLLFISPNSMPSFSPSLNPASPSAAPSTSPSSTLSTEPSLSPSAMPSTSPSTAPSTSPSASPSTESYVSPSAMPSASPLTAPTRSKKEKKTNKAKNSKKSKRKPTVAPTQSKKAKKTKQSKNKKRKDSKETK